MNFEAPRSDIEPKKSEIVERKESSGALDWVRRAVNRIVESPPINNEELGYKSTCGVYGAKIHKDAEGKMMWDNRDARSHFDKWGDRILRAWDEHHVKDPIELLDKHPRAFFHMLPFVAQPKRFRGNTEQILENVHRLGLDEYYGPHPAGVIEIKKPEIYTHGIRLQDIFHQNEIPSEALKKIDRFQATQESARYLSKMHAQYGGVGETLVGSFIFTNHTETEVSAPVLNLPDEVYNQDKKTSEREKMATDLLDLLASVGSEEWRVSDNWDNIQKLLMSILENYEQSDVVELVESLIKRGRLTLPGEEELDEKLSRLAQALKKAFAWHNTQRVKVGARMTARLRGAILDACENRLKAEFVPTPGSY